MLSLTAYCIVFAKKRSCMHECCLSSLGVVRQGGGVIEASVSPQLSAYMLASCVSQQPTLPAAVHMHCSGSLDFATHITCRKSQVMHLCCAHTSHHTLLSALTGRWQQQLLAAFAAGLLRLFLCLSVTSTAADSVLRAAQDLHCTCMTLLLLTAGSTCVVLCL